MDEADEYERSLTGLIVGARDMLLRLTLAVGAGPVTDHAVMVAGLLHDMREPLAARELDAETIAAVRRTEHDRGYRDGFARGYTAGLEAGARGTAPAGRLSLVRPA
jgi:hypothetical protein